VRWLGLFVLIAGCGDNRSPCNYAETDDADNATTAEVSNVTLASGVRTLCGDVDPAHFDIPSSTVDSDRYRITVGGDGKLLVRLAADPAASLLTRLSAKLFDTAQNATLLADVPFAGDHGAQLVELPPADYDLVVAATATGDLSAPVGYRVDLLLDPKCDAATTPPYQEAGDDNDALSVDLAQTPAVAAIGGTPEDTHLHATANNTLHIAGTIDATPYGDSYADRDTYIIRTDSTANELIVRLDWTDPAADLDFYLFDPSTLDTIAAGDLGAAGSQEIRAFGVSPSTAYVLWVGGFKGSHLPATYDVTVCGTHYFH
jgi:hypothetical protein